MPVVRIFLLTYRRNRMLDRALTSLLAQTFTDWVCELHNDAPDDPYPADLVARTGDPRIVLHQHEANWGPVAAFNHAYAGGPEPYASLLEDDNWWEPGFLAAAVPVIEQHPDASLVWVNMRMWREEADGRWTDTGKTIWEAAPGDPPVRVFHWPEALQAFDGLHSNGAMVYQPHAFRPTSVPAAIPFSIIEPARERAATGGLILLTAPLANFALTLETARGDDRDLWLQGQLLLAASYFAAVTVPPPELKRIWQHRRIMQPRGTNLLFLTAFALRRRDLVRAARFSDYLFFLLNFVRHPLSNWRGLRFRRDHAPLWAWLLAQTRPDHLRPDPVLLHKQAARAGATS